MPSNVIPLFEAAKAALVTGEDVRRAPAPTGLVQPTKYPVRTPMEVLPHPKDLDCMAAWDTETSALYVDSDGRCATVSVAFSRKSSPDVVEGFAFPFDQGRADDKGFAFQRDRRGELKVDVMLADPKRDVSQLVRWDGVHVPRGYIGYEVRGKKYLRVDTDAWTEDVNLGRKEWDDLMRWLRLAGEYVGLTAHNDKFDLHMTNAGTRHFPGIDLERWVAWDSMLACPILWPLEPVALKDTSARLWGKEEAEEAQELRDALIVLKRLYGLGSDDGPRYDLLPWDVVGPYAAQDAILALRLAKHQTLMFHEGLGDWHRADRALDQCRTLYRMEKRGFGPYDIPRAIKVAEAIERRVEQLENAMPFQPPTAYRAKVYFFDDLGLRPWKGAEDHRVIDHVPNKKGVKIKKVVKQGTLNVDVAARMAKAGVPFAAEYAELMRLKTANQMNYRGYVNLAGPDGRIRTNYKQVFVRSGRMSVERFQAQAIPRRDSVKIKEIPTYDGPIPHPRDLFLTPPGRRRATIDLSQAELRVAFKFAGCKRGIEQIHDGRDIHGEMATRIFEVQKGEEAFSHYRYISKRAVFGGIFMIGPKSLKEQVWKLAQLDLPFSVCKKTIDGFRTLYPEIEVAYNDSQTFVLQNGYVELVDGSRSYFGPRDFENTAWNRRVQGSLALFNTHWMVEVERRTAQWDALVLSVHDSVTLDLPEDVAERVVAEIQEWTNAEFERWFGIPGSTDVEFGF